MLTSHLPALRLDLRSLYHIDHGFDPAASEEISHAPRHPPELRPPRVVGPT